MSEFSPIAFYPLAGLVLFAGIGVVACRNLIYSAVSMIVCYLAVAGIFVLLNAEFIAIAQVLIYVGAISVLILFVIMLIREKEGDRGLFFHRQAWLAVPVVLVAAIMLALGLGTAWYNSTEAARNPSTEELAKILFNDYALPFELVSLVLLVAIVGAVLLAKKERKP